MKKIFKTGLFTIGLGMTIFMAYQINRRRHDNTEIKILNHVQKQFPTNVVKGSWIQRRAHRYVGEVTILKNKRKVQHQFNADLNGHNLSIN